MIFRPELALKIVLGEKTATRRRLNDNPRSPWYRGHHPGVRYPEGSTFAVNPGRGRPRVCDCEVTARYRQSLLEAGSAYRAEGFSSRLAFMEGWARINGSFVAAEEIEVVEFKVVEPVDVRAARLRLEPLIVAGAVKPS